MKKNILVFPCGSEVALEIYRSLEFSSQFRLIGASSVKDHGSFVYKNYIGDLPNHDSPDFIKQLKYVIKKYQIDAVYPAMDKVMVTIKEAEVKLNTLIIGSTLETNKICASKSVTYQTLIDQIPIPKFEFDIKKVNKFPIFIKPDVGYGSRNTFLAGSYEEAISFLNRHENLLMLLTEYLPGEEWTIDCFSDRNGSLLSINPRVRSRISNGISVNTFLSNIHGEIFHNWAKSINHKLQPRGAWFFQAKLDHQHEFKLLEVAARLSGSSGALRAKGINLALLTIFDAFNINVRISPNKYSVEMDRALHSRYKLGLTFNEIFVDLDDCIIIDNQVNYVLISFLFKAINEGKKITLITRHITDPVATLIKYRIQNIFDKIIHVKLNEKKSLFINTKDAIFIDDSFAERQEVQEKLGIPTFSPEMIDSLL